MNQDQVKKDLLRLDKDVEDFTVTFSGKKSRKVDGLYRHEWSEIIIHNKNFANDNALMYTAIHEFAHHVQFKKTGAPVSHRAHTNLFWDIFHKLLRKAEEKGVYGNVFKSDERFTMLTKKLKDNFIHVDGEIMKELGGLLLEAHTLCRETGASFEDYVDRELLLHRRAAKAIMSIHARDINPEIGYENMKTVASIRDDGVMRLAEKAFMEGHSPDMVKAKFKPRINTAGDTLDKLLGDRARIEKSIERLTRELLRIEEKINQVSGR